MTESIDPSFDPLQTGELIPSQSVEPQSIQSLILELPKNQGRFSQTAQVILDELRVRHRRLEMHGSAEIAPSLLLTVDKISEVLQKEVHLPESHKSNAAVSEALWELSDAKASFLGRSVYIYPFFLKTETGITVRIALVAPQNKEKTDIIPYRRACFKYSEELIVLIIKNLTKKEPVLDSKNPGLFLLKREENGNLAFTPHLFSIETDFVSIVEKGFIPFDSIPVPDFIQDLIQFGLSKQLLFSVSPRYHIAVPQSGFIELLLKHIAVQLDALAAFVFRVLKDVAKSSGHFKAVDQIEDLEKAMPDSLGAIVGGGWKVAYEFISLLKGFSFGESDTDQNFQIRQTVLESVNILETLLAEVQKKGRDLQEEKYIEILSRVKSKVIDNTVRTLTLTIVDVHAELNSLLSMTSDEQTKIVNRLVDDLRTIFGLYFQNDKSGRSICYIVDQRYLRDVQKNMMELAIKNSNITEQLAYLDLIRKDLLERNDLQLDVLSESEVASTNNNEQITAIAKPPKYDLIEFQKTFHLPTAVVTILLGSVISTVASLFYNDLQMLVSGVISSFVIGLLLAYFSNRMSAPAKEKQVAKKSTTSSINDFYLTLVKASEEILFPKKFNTIFDKVYDPKKLRYTIESQIEEIRALLPHSEKKKDAIKLASEVEVAIMQAAAIIRVPENLLVKGRSKEYIISKNDLKTLVFRDKLADHFRKEASVYKADAGMMAYLNYLIKEIEFGYSKYVKS
ncbi:MAG: hypothetical protein O9264_12530 [Leptospira sp.]|nr:hypothetical protein [Leptospira sp.]